ncbi:helix-turn-helix transcriptional regulator [Salipaludibacillus agaradhaerens]|uniref:Helix-turn-helix transcriptional regulator n=1 Tax=Salipaludibacillus agaradhaerens TaxID=76935 RepID=A0A9Q4B2B2_SALAG|nr:helix-turn-helix transcriptional regulator [Salipaludibacillus agaradhaerens]MCR6096911.1 helix-turn-helix transcriptional regulator [Salipaludibacillus agaradhaerens]MCR6116681.1 helix-turn-helix transcriptional regulator [Salipaludibacillus agaradhaerens]
MNTLMLARIKNKKTKQDVARAIGVSPVMYGYIESGERTADSDTSIKIANYLNMDVNEIFLPSRLTVREVFLEEVK